MGAPRIIEWNGAQAKEEIGTGAIEKIEQAGNKPPVVFIRDDRAALKYSIRGSLGYDAEVHPDLSDTNPQAIVGRRRVAYRVITHRREGVDPSIPFDKLTAGDDGQRVRALVSLMPAPWHRGQITTRSTGPVGESAPDQAARSFAEGYEFLAAVGCAELAYELLTREPGTLTRPRFVEVAGKLLAAADWVQQAIRPDHTVDRAAISHTRARGAVRAAIERHNLPRISEPDLWGTIAQDARVILEVAQDLLADGDNGQAAGNDAEHEAQEAALPAEAPHVEQAAGAPEKGAEAAAGRTFRQTCLLHGWKPSSALGLIVRSGQFPGVSKVEDLDGDLLRSAETWLAGQPGYQPQKQTA